MITVLSIIGLSLLAVYSLAGIVITITEVSRRPQDNSADPSSPVLWADFDHTDRSL